MTMEKTITFLFFILFIYKVKEWNTLMGQIWILTVLTSNIISFWWILCTLHRYEVVFSEYFWNITYFITSKLSVYLTLSLMNYHLIKGGIIFAETVEEYVLYRRHSTLLIQNFKLTDFFLPTLFTFSKACFLLRFDIF